MKLKDYLNTFIIVSFLLFTTQGLKFILWNTYVEEYVYYAVCLFILVFSLFCSFGRIKPHGYNYKYVKLVLIILVLSEISKTIYIGGVRPKSTLMLLSMVAGFSTYFVLKKYRISEIAITRAMFLVGLITLIIQIYQYINPRLALFGIQELGEENTLRYGINRTMPGCLFVTMYCLYYSWVKILKKFNLFFVIVFCLSLVSLYLYLTRQFLVAAGLTLMYPLISVKNNKVKVVLVTGFIFSVLWIYSDLLFGNIISYSQDDSSSWNMRMEEIAYFLDFFIRKPFYMLFGYGCYNDDYGKWIDNYKYYLVDVGFIGEMVKFGVFYIVIYFMLVKKYLINKSTSLFVKLFILSSFVHCLFIFPYRYIYECFIWVAVLYINELDENKKRVQYNKYV